MFHCVDSRARPANGLPESVENGKLHSPVTENPIAQNSDVLQRREISSEDLAGFFTFLYYLVLLKECKQCSSVSIAVAAGWPLGLGFFKKMKLYPECDAYKLSALNNKISTMMGEV